MAKYIFGEIVLLNLPFSDNLNIKKRPALILIDTGDDDIIAARITTQQTKSQYDIYVNAWKDSGLLQESFVRLNKIATLEKKLIQKKLGKLQSEDLEKVRRVIKNLWNF